MSKLLLICWFVIFLLEDTFGKTEPDYPKFITALLFVVAWHIVSLNYKVRVEHD